MDARRAAPGTAPNLLNLAGVDPAALQALLAPRAGAAARPAVEERALAPLARNDYAQLAARAKEVFDRLSRGCRRARRGGRGRGRGPGRARRAAAPRRGAAALGRACARRADVPRGAAADEEI